MFNTMQFAIGFLLAENEKKRLIAKGATVPKNFVVNNSILFGALGNSVAPAVLLQNETHKKDKEADEKIKQNLTDLLNNVSMNAQNQSLVTLLSNIQDNGVKAKYITVDNNNNNTITPANFQNFIASLVNPETFNLEIRPLLNP